VVPHGFDPADQRAAATPVAGPLHLVYTGRFYEGVRTPEPLLRALAALMKRRSLADDLRLTFVGTLVPTYARLAEQLGLTSLVNFTGRVPFSESARIAAAADVLLVIDAPAGDSLFLPSKLIDYLPLAKPILGLTPAVGATADVLRLLDQPIVAPDDDAAIASLIEKLIAQKRDGVLGVPPSFAALAARYDIRATTRAFAEILEQCA
jgi:glycosyltransferase involved in cell wall biosynthesis